MNQFTRFPDLQDDIVVDHEQQPRDPRQRISARLEIRKSGYNKCKADVLNISRSGFQLDATLNLRAGEKFLLWLPGMQSLSATVVWHDDFRSGCKFDHPISEYVYDDLLRRLSSG